MKMTSNGRQPQNIKNGISQQPLIGSNSNLKLMLRGSNQNGRLLAMETTSHGRQHQMCVLLLLKEDTKTCPLCGKVFPNKNGLVVHV